MTGADGHRPFGTGEDPSDRGRAPSSRGSADLIRRLRAGAVLLLLVVSALVLRGLWRAQPPAVPLPLVEVQGVLSAPGIYELPEGTTVREAFILAGADPDTVLDPFADLPVHHGYRLVLLPDGSARVWLADERLLVGLPVDPNTADADMLEQLPGIGPSRAAAIVEERSTRGPFALVDDLVRVRGIGPATLDGIRPFVSIDGIGEPPSAGGDPTREAGP